MSSFVELIFMLLLFFIVQQIIKSLCLLLEFYFLSIYFGVWYCSLDYVSFRFMDWHYFCTLDRLWTEHLEFMMFAFETKQRLLEEIRTLKIVVNFVLASSGTDSKKSNSSGNSTETPHILPLLFQDYACLPVCYISVLNVLWRLLCWRLANNKYEVCIFYQTLLWAVLFCARRADWRVKMGLLWDFL